ncbi:hypothetical protein ACVWWO_002753 [Bradyrhizobium sp. F1.13.1]
MLTTASITFSATSAMPSGPRAEAGVPNALKAPTASAASPKRKRVGAMVAAVIVISRKQGFGVKTALERGDGASADLNGPQDPDNKAKTGPSPSLWRWCDG